jgi:hypothetical protein
MSAGEGAAPTKATTTVAAATFSAIATPTAATTPLSPEATGKLPVLGLDHEGSGTPIPLPSAEVLVTGVSTPESKDPLQLSTVPLSLACWRVLEIAKRENSFAAEAAEKTAAAFDEGRWVQIHKDLGKRNEEKLLLEKKMTVLEAETESDEAKLSTCRGALKVSLGFVN